jgi:hypothetical protein
VVDEVGKAKGKAQNAKGKKTGGRGTFAFCFLRFAF